MSTTPPNRPLSPHLQVYKLPLTGLISITHRMTGVFLSLGLILFVCIISSVASGQESYANMQAILDFWLIRLIYWGFVYALFFHLCHGTRHLIWDSGQTFEHATLQQYALYELAASLILTLFTFIIA